MRVEITKAIFFLLHLALPLPFDSSDLAHLIAVFELFKLVFKLLLVDPFHILLAQIFLALR
jgi:hypothetical protein